MKNTIIISVIVAVIVGVGSFYGGMLSGKSQVTSARQQRFGQVTGLGQNGQFNRQAGPGAPGRNGGFVNGNIIAQDDKSITVKSAAGGSKIVFLSDKTQIMKSVDGSVADLETGKNVMITGSLNSDGSLTAQSIQLRSLKNETSTQERIIGQ